MPSRLRLLQAGITSILLALALGQSARGQVRFPRGGPQPQAKAADFHQASGTIEDLGPGRLTMKSDGDQLRLVQCTPNTRVQVLGKATAEFLGNGQWVSFTAEVDKRRGTVGEKVIRLTIFTPTTKKQPGAYADQGFGTPSGPGFGGEAKQRDAAAGPVGGKNSPSGSQSFEVRGQITAIKNGKMTLRVPTEYFKPSLKVELADEPEIDLELIGLEWLPLARKGDKITVRGQQLGDKALLAAEIEVSLAEPAGAAQAKRKPAAKGERTGRSSRRGNAQPAEKPAEPDGRETEK